MTFKQIRAYIVSKYKTGQVIAIKTAEHDNPKFMRKAKMQIVRFYPYHVSCLVSGYRESFTYGDMLKFTQIKG